MKKGVSLDEILVAGLIIEPLEETKDITRTKIPDFERIDIRGKATHCVHLVLKGEGLREKGNRYNLYATGVAYGEKIGAYPFRNGKVDWGGQAGTRRYKKVDLDEITTALSGFSDGEHAGTFMRFDQPLKLGNLVPEMVRKDFGDKTLLDLSDGLQIAYGI